MYNCKNCNNLETLYFQCDKCSKLLCRKCISHNKHECLINNNTKYTLDMFCDDDNCISINNLLICKNCKKKFCIHHKKSHECQNNNCCCIC